MFLRAFDTTGVSLLSENPLFRSKLMPDIMDGTVFPAIRGRYIDFYYKGGRLLKFRKEFCTHKKYASIIRSKGDYLTESDLQQNVELIRDFSEGYDSIKENCSLYQGVEAAGVSSVYHKYPYTQQLDIVVLDIEVSFEGIDDDRAQDRIDLLLFNKKTQTLRFYEAKHFSNKAIWSTANTPPRVTSQVFRYNKQLKKQEAQILSQYANYIRIVNELFGCDMPEPRQIDEKVTLLVFGFDRDQQQGRMKQLLVEDGSLSGMQYYFVGDISKVVIDNMWKAVKCG